MEDNVVSVEMECLPHKYTLPKKDPSECLHPVVYSLVTKNKWICQSCGAEFVKKYSDIVGSTPRTDKVIDEINKDNYYYGSARDRIDFEIMRDFAKKLEIELNSLNFLPKLDI